MRKSLALAGLALVLAGCGGGGGGSGTDTGTGSGSGGGSGGGTATYYARINSFSITPSVARYGDSIQLSADFDYNSANGTAYFEAKLIDNSSGNSLETLKFHCSDSISGYGCTTSFTVSCAYNYNVTTNSYYLGCTLPDGTWREIYFTPPVDVTVNLTMQTTDFFNIYEDRASASIRLE